jgi:uncharacterized protein YcnI
MARRPGLAAVAALAALTLAPGASAHGSVRPTLAEPGSAREFVFLIANGRPDAGMVGFSVELPAGATLEDVSADQPRWTPSSSANRVEWRGGPVEPGSFESFALRARMPDTQGTVSFTGRELFDDGSGPPFKLDVVLAATSGGAAADARDEGARTLGKAALFVSIAALVLAAAGFFLGLGRWLRGP